MHFSSGLTKMRSSNQWFVSAALVPPLLIPVVFFLPPPQVQIVVESCRAARLSNTSDESNLSIKSLLWDFSLPWLGHFLFIFPGFSSEHMPGFFLTNPWISVISFWLSQLGKRCRWSRLANPHWIRLTKYCAFFVVPIAFWLVANHHHTCHNTAQIISAVIGFEKSLILHWIRFLIELLLPQECVRPPSPVCFCRALNQLNEFTSAEKLECKHNFMVSGYQKCLSKAVYFPNLLRFVLRFGFVCYF